jgi:hypothetical protein
VPHPGSPRESHQWRRLGVIAQQPRSAVTSATSPPLAARPVGGVNVDAPLLKLAAQPADRFGAHGGPAIALLVSDPSVVVGEELEVALTPDMSRGLLAMRPDADPGQSLLLSCVRCRLSGNPVGAAVSADTWRCSLTGCLVRLIARLMSLRLGLSPGAQTRTVRAGRGALPLPRLRFVPQPLHLSRFGAARTATGIRSRRHTDLGLGGALAGEGVAGTAAGGRRRRRPLICVDFMPAPRRGGRKAQWAGAPAGDQWASRRRRPPVMRRERPW